MNTESLSEESARRRCHNCRHFNPDQNACIPPFDEPDADAGWCRHPSNDNQFWTLRFYLCEKHEGA